MQTQLGQTLLATLTGSAALATVLPPILQFVTNRFSHDRAKKNAAWACCLVVTLLLAAGQGAFNPVAEAYRAGVSSAGMAGALWTCAVMLATIFGVITTVTSQMYDKFYKPLGDVLSSKINPAPVSVPDALRAELQKAGGATTNAVASNAAAPSAVAPIPAEYDIGEGTPTLDVDTSVDAPEPATATPATTPEVTPDGH